MKKVILFVFATTTIFSCRKERIPTAISYHNLNNLVVSAVGRADLDINKDGIVDFTLATNVVSPNINDHIQFRLFPKGNNRILNSAEQFPKALIAGESVTIQDQLPYYWTKEKSTLIIERVITLDNTKSYWSGVWKDRQNSYLPIQIEKDGKRFCGWIRISVPEPGFTRIVLHDAALSQVANVSIKAGHR